MTSNRTIAGILETVIHGLAECLSVPATSIDPQAELSTQVGWDSVAAVQHLMFLEDEFERQFDPAALFDQQTPQAIAEFIQRAI